MNTAQFILALPLGFGAGLCINYILFKGIEVYSKAPNKKALSKKRNNLLYALVTGITFVSLAAVMKDSGIVISDIVQSLGFDDANILIAILIAIGWLIVKMTKDKEKKDYLSMSMYLLALFTTVFLLLADPSE
ncbi:MAG: hypothetical protein ACLGH8_03985 [Bacteroidia bacterium]